MPSGRCAGIWNAAFSPMDSPGHAVANAAMTFWWRSPVKAVAFALLATARRMAETAAHLADHVLPRLPVRSVAPQAAAVSPGA